MLTILADSFLVAARNNPTGATEPSYPKVAERLIETPLQKAKPARPSGPARRRLLGRF